MRLDEGYLAQHDKALTQQWIPVVIKKVIFNGSHLDVMTKAEVNRNYKKIIQIVPVAPNEYIVEVYDDDLMPLSEPYQEVPHAT